MADRYFLNWSSGTGGDFLIGILHLISPFNNVDSVTVEPFLNKWGVNTLDRLRPFEIEDFSIHQQLLDATEINEVFHYHQLNENKLKFNNIVPVNLSCYDILTTVYAGTLYNIKCRPAENIKRVAIVNQNAHIEDGHNFDYKKLIIDADIDEIKRLLCLFNRETDLQLIQKIIRLYHLYNCSLLDQLIDHSKEQYTQVNSIEEIIDILQFA